MDKETLTVLQFKRLVRIALHNLSVDLLRKYDRLGERETDLDDGIMIEADMEDAFAFLENHVPVLDIQMLVKDDLLYEILMDMTQQQRDVLYLHYCMGWSDETISKHMQMSRASVQRMRSRLILEMREKYIRKRGE